MPVILHALVSERDGDEFEGEPTPARAPPVAATSTGRAVQIRLEALENACGDIRRLITQDTRAIERGNNHKD